MLQGKTPCHAMRVQCINPIPSHPMLNEQIKQKQNIGAKNEYPDPPRPVSIHSAHVQPHLSCPSIGPARVTSTRQPLARTPDIKKIGKVKTVQVKLYSTKGDCFHAYSCARVISIKSTAAPVRVIVVVAEVVLAAALVAAHMDLAVRWATEAGHHA